MHKDDTAFKSILMLLHARLGVDLTLYKSATLQRRMERRRAGLGLRSLADYLAYVRKNTGEAGLLLNDLLIQVTEFFRDPPVFHLLKERYLPRLLGEKGRQTLRIWVPACSTGE